MDHSSDDLGEIVCVSRLKPQAFKQPQLERPIKSGAVIPGSKLEEAKELDLQHGRDFEAAGTDEERHRGIDTTRPVVAPRSFITTREPFEGQMGTKADTLEIEGNKKTQQLNG